MINRNKKTERNEPMPQSKVTTARDKMQGPVAAPLNTIVTRPIKLLLNAPPVKPLSARSVTPHMLI